MTAILQNFRRADRTATRRWRASSLAAACALSCAASCATYTDRTAVALSDFERGNFDGALASYSDEKTTDSTFLAGAESGMVALSAGRWDDAQTHLDKAAEYVHDLEEKALITPEKVAETAMTWLVNESSAAYQGEGYERVQLHATLAMTYLARGNIEGVGIEARRANKLLETEETLYSKKYEAGGLGHFMSALSYELGGGYDDAFIDYKRMVEKNVGVDLAGKALVRIAHRLNYTDELEGLEQKYGAAPEIPADAASIVVIAGVGLGPFKVENTVTLPLAHGVGQFSVPEFVRRPQTVTAVDLRVTGASAPLRTSLIEDVARVATENLSDRLAWLALKSALRGALKYELTRQLGRELGKNNDSGEAMGYILGGLATIATERADLRAWLTLPDSWQAARMFVAPGEHEIALDAVGGENTMLGTFKLEPGETMFIFARTLGSRLYAYPIGGQRTDGVPQPPPAPQAAESTTPPTSTSPRT
jgi:hypothetical protein